MRIRGAEVREIRNRITVLRRPRERCLFLPKRGHNIFASVAETMWVLAGRNDIAWLRPFLPRVNDYSDDGTTWRAAYGPRLRAWRGIDQLDEVRRLLLAETATRRAVISLYDPALDFVNSKDIPCNNWLHLLIRDGALHLNVVLRSSDVVWGFSGINSFEWSMLHEMMARWTGAKVGEVTYFASSLHLYDRHYEMARNAVDAFRGVTCYDFGLESPEFTVPWDEFAATMQTWIECEAAARNNPTARPNLAGLEDPFMRTSLLLCRLFHGRQAGWSDDQLKDALAELPACDLAAAAYEYIGRKSPAVLADIPEHRITDFSNAYRANGAIRPVSLPTLMAAIKELHARKNEIYGPAWKKRGEFTSIHANLARKVDRIEHFHQTGGAARDESIFDSAIDLFVYATKYRLFLLELAGNSGALPSGAPEPFSDHVSNFDHLADQTAPTQGAGPTPSEIGRDLVAAFAAMHAGAADPVAARLERAGKLAELALVYAVRLAEFQPAFLDDLNNS